MTRASHRSFLTLAAFACAICVTPIAVAAIPPERGALLIVSLRGDHGAALAKWAANDGLRLIGAGPIPGSFVVHGSADRARQLATAHDAVVLRAPQAGCGPGG